jgi:hypothetical protein
VAIERKWSLSLVWDRSFAFDGASLAQDDGEIRFAQKGVDRSGPCPTWERSLPRIPDDYLKSVIYVYPSTEDAQRGMSVGGTGFLIVSPAEGTSGSTLYAVTNSHVAIHGRAIRLANDDNQTKVMPVAVDDWIHHPAGDDVAVLPIHISEGTDRFHCFPTSIFLTRELLMSLNVGPGDDTYFMGRFIGHDGTQRNTPVVRFGSIAMLPNEPVYQKDRGFHQESFLVEARSLSGFSGSPVLLYIPPFSHRFRNGGYSWDEDGLSPSTTTLLLGIDYGSMRLGDENLTNSGIMAVVPVWKLSELLESPEVREDREKGDGRERGIISSVILDTENPD